MLDAFNFFILLSRTQGGGLAFERKHKFIINVYAL